VRIFKKIFSITRVIFPLLGAITVLAIIMFITFLFASITSYTGEQTAIVKNSNLSRHIYDEYEPSIESIIENFVWNDGQELPVFPEWPGFGSVEHQLEEREWFETNGNAFTGILERLLSEIDSSFSGVEFSILIDDNRNGIWIVYADVSVNQITDNDILYLLHSVISLGRRHGILISFRIELNLDNGNQLFIEPRDIIAYTIAYREQENTTAIQDALDWWSIASGIIDIRENTISWRGFVENNEGNLEIRYLPRSPFE